MSQQDLGQIRAFVAGLLAERDDRAPFDDAESLVMAGRLDSLAIVKMVSFVEARFGVDFDRIEFDPLRMDSVAGIAGLVEEWHGFAGAN